jgi:hypothetical protein
MGDDRLPGTPGRPPRPDPRGCGTVVLLLLGLLVGLSLVFVGFCVAVLALVALPDAWPRPGHIPWQTLVIIFLIGLLISCLGIWLIRWLSS